VALGVTLTRRMRRWSCARTTKMNRIRQVSVGTAKKSMATVELRWFSRNVRRVCEGWRPPARHQLGWVRLIELHGAPVLRQNRGETPPMPVVRKKPPRPEYDGRRDHLPRPTSSQDSEQSVNNSLPNTKERQVLTRATGTKNPRAQLPALCSPETAQKD
jgi:hypothetical protein